MNIYLALFKAALALLPSSLSQSPYVTCRKLGTAAERAMENLKTQRVPVGEKQLWVCVHYNGAQRE